MAAQEKFWEDLQKHTVSKYLITPEMNKELK